MPRTMGFAALYPSYGNTCTVSLPGNENGGVHSSMRSVTNSFAPGETASPVEVASLSRDGLRLLAGDLELFRSYQEFPSLKDAPVFVVLRVEDRTRSHFYWHNLDLDLRL
jgi:hypothetical protein